MTHSAAIARLSPDFNDFLFGSISEDKHGMPLSVLSALARMNVDPWQEAAELAALPREAAIQRLTHLIAALPGGTSAHPGPATNVAGLIALLPQRAGRATGPRDGMPVLGTKPSAVPLAYVILMIVILGAQWIAAMHQHPTEVESPQASIPGAVSPPQPAIPGSDQSLSNAPGRHDKL
jgi:hypothetical protein